MNMPSTAESKIDTEIRALGAVIIAELAVFIGLPFGESGVDSVHFTRVVAIRAMADRLRVFARKMEQLACPTGQT